MLRWLKNLRVGAKIGLGFTVIGLIFILNIILIFNIFNKTNALNDRIADLRSPTAENGFMMLNGINHSMAALRGWLLMGEKHFKEELKQVWIWEIDLPLNTLSVLSNNWTNPDNNVRLKSIAENLKDLRAYQNTIESLPRTSGWAEANRIMIEEAAPTAKAISILIQEMAENQKQLLQADLVESKRILGRGEKLLWATLFVSISFGFLVAIPITFSITRPLQRITEFSKKIAAGNLNQKSIKRASKDEIGILTHNLNQMVFGLLGNLKEKEARNFAILYNIVDPLIEINDMGIISTFNPAAVKVFGYSAAEAIGKNVSMLMPDPYQSEHDSYLENYKKTGQAKIIGTRREMVGKRKDGSLFPLDLSVNEFKVNNKKRYVGICRDFTEHKKAEEKIEKTNRELEKQNWLITLLGELSDKMRGDQDSIELAQNVINCLAEGLNAHSALIYLVEENKLRAVAGFGFTRQEEYSKEFMIGEGLVGKVVLEKQKFVLNDVAEGHIGIASGLGDALPGNIMIIPLLHEDAVMGVVELGSSDPITDPQVEFVNQAEDSIAIALNSALARKQMHRLLAETQAQAEELTAQKEELEQVQEELQQTNQFLEQQTQNLVRQKSEIEEKNELVKIKVKELETAGKYKSEFLANMSHELRTPLNSLLILSQLLAENKENNLTEKQKEFARTIHSSGSDLLNLISDILDLSKVEAGKMELNLEDVSLVGLSESLKRTFLPLAEKQKLDFKIEFDEGLSEHIWTDVQRVEQIVKNFLSNAFKFTETGGITLQFHTVSPGTRFSRQTLNDSNAVGISVIDTGKGIPQEKQDYIFEAFQQEDGTTSRKFGGTGLGLSISKELSSLLAGEIKIESEEGVGSTFTIYLPESHPSPRAEIEEVETQTSEFVPESQAAPRNGSASQLILIIEDDPHFSKIVSTTAKEKGFDSVVAGEGKLGLELAKKNPTAIIMDVDLPGIGGLEVLEQLQADDATRNIPVYFVSAHHDRAQEALKKGAVEFIEKPASLDKLENIFVKIISSLKRVEKQILVVEDNEGMRDSMIGLLSSDHVTILTAENAKEAIQQLRNHPIDCMTVDLGLNGESGFDLLHEVKDDPTLPNVPVIVYTGENLTLSQEEELGCFSKAVIIKGAKSPERLLDEINLFLYGLNQISEEKNYLEEVGDLGVTGVPKATAMEPSVVSEEEVSVLFHGKKVLLADDDMRNIFALTHLLEAKDIDVIVARNGQEAIDTLKENPDTDLVLMDIMMPEMDGYTAMQEIRKNKTFSETPIIAITAKAMKNDKKKCLDSGASDYLTKPIDKSELFTQMSVWFQEDIG
jgi:PAS domain S-box-containing protein